MHKRKINHDPITLEVLDQKLDFEIRRLIREKEEGIASYISRKTVLNGVSRLVFKNRAGAKVTLSYRLDTGGTLRFATEKQFMNMAPARKELPVAHVGRTSRDIES